MRLALKCETRDRLVGRLLCAFFCFCTMMAASAFNDEVIIALYEGSEYEDEGGEDDQSGENDLVGDDPEANRLNERLTSGAVGDANVSRVAPEHPVMVEGRLELTNTEWQDVTLFGVHRKRFDFVTKHVLDFNLADWLNVDIAFVLKSGDKIDRTVLKESRRVAVLRGLKGDQIQLFINSPGNFYEDKGSGTGGQSHSGINTGRPTAETDDPVVSTWFGVTWYGDGGAYCFGFSSLEGKTINNRYPTSN